MKNMLKIIRKQAVFVDLSDKEIQQLEPIIFRQNYKEGEVVFDTQKRPNHLFIVESGSFILHLANNEYKTLNEGQLFGEIGVINEDFRSGSVKAGEAASLVLIGGDKLFDDTYIDPIISLKIMRALSKRITNYLRSKEQISTKEIIEQGENDQVEFKSTLRWNLYIHKKDKAIEKAALKTLVAFMNTKGGTLIIGVADDGEILGLENDKFANHDKLLLHLTKIVQDRIGTLFMKFLQFSIEQVNQKDILRIDCQPATTPVYLLDGNQEHFFIRTGPSTTDLRLSKVYPYIKGRFEQKLTLE